MSIDQPFFQNLHFKIVDTTPVAHLEGLLGALSTPAPFSVFFFKFSTNYTTASMGKLQKMLIKTFYVLVLKIASM